MPLYMVVLSDPDDAPQIEAVVRESERAKLGPGSWVIYRNQGSAEDVAKALKISDTLAGLVVTMHYYSGFADASLVEKLEALKARKGTT